MLQHSERTVSPWLALTAATEKSHVAWYCYSCVPALALLPAALHPLSWVFCGFDVSLLLIILLGTVRILGADGPHLSLTRKNSITPCGNTHLLRTPLRPLPTYSISSRLQCISSLWAETRPPSSLF